LPHAIAFWKKYEEAMEMVRQMKGQIEESAKKEGARKANKERQKMEQLKLKKAQTKDEKKDEDGSSNNTGSDGDDGESTSSEEIEEVSRTSTAKKAAPAKEQAATAKKAAPAKTAPAEQAATAKKAAPAKKPPAKRPQTARKKKETQKRKSKSREEEEEEQQVETAPTITTDEPPGEGIVPATTTEGKDDERKDDDQEAIVAVENIVGDPWFFKVRWASNPTEVVDGGLPNTLYDATELALEMVWRRYRDNPLVVLNIEAAAKMKTPFKTCVVPRWRGLPEFARKKKWGFPETDLQRFNRERNKEGGSEEERRDMEEPGGAPYGRLDLVMKGSRELIEVGNDDSGVYSPKLAQLPNVPPRSRTPAPPDEGPTEVTVMARPEPEPPARSAVSAMASLFTSSPPPPGVGNPPPTAAVNLVVDDSISTMGTGSTHTPPGSGGTSDGGEENQGKKCKEARDHNFEECLDWTYRTVGNLQDKPLCEGGCGRKIMGVPPPPELRRAAIKENEEGIWPTATRYVGLCHHCGEAWCYQCRVDNINLSRSPRKSRGGRKGKEERQHYPE
jgi:hypothetical protein